MASSKSYFNLFSVENIAEALFKNTTDDNLKNKDLDLFNKSQASKIYKTNNTVWAVICHQITGKQKLYRKTLKKYVTKCYDTFRTKSEEIKLLYDNLLKNIDSSNKNKISRLTTSKHEKNYISNKQPSDLDKIIETSKSIDDNNVEMVQESDLTTSIKKDNFNADVDF